MQINFSFADGLCVTLRSGTGLVCSSHDQSKKCRYFDGSQFKSGPPTKYGHNSGGLIHLNDEALIVGGHEPDSKSGKYNLETEILKNNTWQVFGGKHQLSAVMKSHYCDFSLVEFDGKIYAFGGMIDGLWRATERVFVFEEGWKESGKILVKLIDNFRPETAQTKSRSYVNSR